MLKKLSIISVVLAILILSISTISLAFSIDMKLDNTEKIEKNSEVVYTLTFDEKIIGASFKISYDSSKLELVESKMVNLLVSKNDGKIACVYFDMNKTAIDTCNIKFKAKENIENVDLKFELKEAKFITENNEISYSLDNIKGSSKIITIESENNSKNEIENNSYPSSLSNSNSNNISNNNNNNSNNAIKKNSTKIDNTVASSDIPKTGITDYLGVPIIIISMFAIFFLIKIKQCR